MEVPAMRGTRPRIANGNIGAWRTTRANVLLATITLAITICFLFNAETRSEDIPASISHPPQNGGLAVDKTEAALLEDLRTLEAQKPGSIEVAKDLDLLAWYYWNHGRFSDAEPLLMQSLAIKEKILPSDDPAIEENVARLGNIYAWEG